MFQLFLCGRDLVAHCQTIGKPLPFSLSSLEKDRGDGRLGGVPYRRLGGAIIYNPDEVFAFIAGQPIIQPKRHATSSGAKAKRGKPSKAESVEAERRGFTVRQLRAIKAGDAS
jgi:hypothetical protein